MRRILVALVVSLVVVSRSTAELPSPFELVAGLRSAGMTDLALARLLELQEAVKTNPNALPANEKVLLPLEIARTQLEAASRETEDGKRSGMIAKARADFDNFIKANPNHPAVASANVELAKLDALFAKGMLSKGRRLEGNAKALEYSKARPAFDKAIGRYKAAQVLLDNRLKALDAKDPLAVKLRRERLEAELDAAILTYEKALTFVGNDERTLQGKAFQEAQKMFSKLADTNGTNRVGLLAYVWDVRCEMEIGNPPQAYQKLTKFESAQRQNREAADAIRLVRYWFINELRDPESKDSPAVQLAKTEADAVKWLKMYPDALGTSEGLGTLFLLARTHEAQGTKLPGAITVDPKTKKITSISGTAKAHLEAANKIYKDLTESENEYSERAQRSRLQNQLIILDAEGRGGDPDPKAIRTLEAGFIAAQVQIARLLNAKATVGQKDGMTEEQVEKEEDRRSKNAIEYLERGLRSITPRDTPREIFDAQMLLIQFLTQYNRSVEAAVLGEALARNNPRAPRAAFAAQLAVYAYNTSLAKAKQPGVPTDPEIEAADLGRIKAMGEFAEKTWPNEGPTDGVRHVLAFYQSNRDKNYEEAWKTYSRISSGYADIAQARREMAAAMFYLVKSDEKDARKNREEQRQKITAKAAQWKTTLDALEALVEPPPTARSNEIESYAGAKTMAAQLYFMSGDYDKTKAVVDSLVVLLGKKSSFPADRSLEMAYTAKSLRYAAFQSQAADLLRSKDYAGVASKIDPEVKLILEDIAKGPPMNTTPGFDRYRRAQRDVLIVAMTAAVQEKKIDRANELLDALEKSGGSLEANINVLNQLVGSVRSQIDSLKAEKKDDEAKELGASFTEFLDKVAGAQKMLSNAMLGFLARGYAGVDNHVKAAELYQQAIDKAGDAVENVRVKQQLQYLQARSYRLAGGKENFDKAKALMKTIVGDPLGDKLKAGEKRPWGYSTMDIRKEYCMLLEDQGLFASAVQNWQRISAEFVRGGMPAPLNTEKYEAQRDNIFAAAEVIDAFFPGVAYRNRVQVVFRAVLPAEVARRKASRAVYFDLFYETYRCSARAYAQIAANPKGTKVDVPAKLADIAQKLFDLTTKNTDVPPETLDDIAKLLEQHPIMKKKYDELMAANPPAKTN